MKLSAIKTINAKESVIYLASARNFSGKVLGLSDAASTYVESAMKNGEEPILVNEFNRFVVIVPVPAPESRTLFLEGLRKAGQKVQALCKTNKINRIQAEDKAAGSAGFAAFCEGFVLASYSFSKYFSDKKGRESYPEELKIKGDVRISELKAVTGAVFFTRDLVNEPYIAMGVGELASEAKRMGAESGIKVEVFSKKKIEALKMGGLLAVNRASKEDPAFIVMEYKPKGAKNIKPLVLVGKGVVFDTGGSSLKTSAGMTTMKCDMAGAAAVLGAMKAIADNKLPVYTVALIPATDNFLDAHAIVPGDVITMYSGKTVEVLNTDAEGRLILADALHYAKKYDPSLVIDIATLTGAAARAIGEYGIAAHEVNAGNFKFALEDAGSEVYERLVWFPMWDEYGEMIKSDIADMKNIGGTDAGMITAAKFLQHFTGYPWIHLDIAGPAFLEQNISYWGKGATGVGVRLLYNFAANYFNPEKPAAKSRKK
jgi:leucyl aminopeptidase